MAIADLRRTQRYPLSLPVTIEFPIQKDSGAQKGRTRDISTKGVYFRSECELESGNQVNLTMKLPAELTHGKDVFVNVTGKVVRVDGLQGADDKSIGIAATIEDYKMVRIDPTERKRGPKRP